MSTRTSCPMSRRTRPTRLTLNSITYLVRTNIGECYSMTIYRFPEVQKALQDYYRQIEEHQDSLRNQGHDIVQPFTSFRNSAYFFADTYAMYTNIDGKQTISANFSQHDVELRLKYMLLDLVFVPFMSTAEYYAIKLGQKDPHSASYAKIHEKTERRTQLSHLIGLIPQLNEKKNIWDFAI